MDNIDKNDEWLFKVDSSSLGNAENIDETSFPPLICVAAAFFPFFSVLVFRCFPFSSFSWPCNFRSMHSKYLIFQSNISILTIIGNHRFLSLRASPQIGHKYDKVILIFFFNSNFKIMKKLADLAK